MPHQACETNYQSLQIKSTNTLNDTGDAHWAPPCLWEGHLTSSSSGVCQTCAPCASCWSAGGSRSASPLSPSCWSVTSLEWWQQFSSSHIRCGMGLCVSSLGSWLVEVSGSLAVSQTADLWSGASFSLN